MECLFPIRLEASLHETIWGGRNLELGGWKNFTRPNAVVGEAWETEINTLAQNEPYVGMSLGKIVEELGPDLLGEQVMKIFGRRFPLLAKFIDANDKLSVQVHPDDVYAAEHENGKLGKTEFWYILGAKPGATIIHGFKAPTSQKEVQRAIENVTLDNLLHEETVSPGDIIFVPAGTVHAIGSGILLYELQEYSDITYRMYDYGRRSANGTPRELHIERSLAVTHYDKSQRIKAVSVPLANGSHYEERCLVACPYFVTRELHLSSGARNGQTERSCVILSSLDAAVEIQFGPSLKYRLALSRGQTMVFPAVLGGYRIEGTGTLLLSYVPEQDDAALRLWRASNQ